MSKERSKTVANLEKRFEKLFQNNLIKSVFDDANKRMEWGKFVKNLKSETKKFAKALNKIQDVFPDVSILCKNCEFDDTVMISELVIDNYDNIGLHMTIDDYETEFTIYALATKSVYGYKVQSNIIAVGYACLYTDLKKVEIYNFQKIGLPLHCVKKLNDDFEILKEFFSRFCKMIENGLWLAGARISFSTLENSEIVTKQPWE
jgi:hypothetical protein